MVSTHRTRLGIYDDLDGRTLRQVGVSDLEVSNDPADRLVTWSLGSCIGLTMYDPVARVGGMLHCLLPGSACNPKDAEAVPERYVDTGVLLLIHRVEQLGARRGRLRVHLAGAGNQPNNGDLFLIGEQNKSAARRVLEEHRLRVVAEEVGGSEPLTLALDIDSGITTIRGRKPNCA